VKIAGGEDNEGDDLTEAAVGVLHRRSQLMLPGGVVS